MGNISLGKHTFCSKPGLFENYPRLLPPALPTAGSMEVHRPWSHYCPHLSGHKKATPEHSERSPPTQSQQRRKPFSRSVLRRRCSPKHSDWAFRALASFVHGCVMRWVRTHIYYKGGFGAHQSYVSSFRIKLFCAGGMRSGVGVGWRREKHMLRACTTTPQGR